MPTAEERAILDTMEGPIIAANDAGRIAYMNQPAQRLFACGANVIGQPLSSLMPQRMRKAHEAGFKRWQGSHESRLLGQSVRVPALRADGREIEVELTLRMFRRPDGSALVVASLRDTTTDAPPTQDVIELETRFQRRLYELL